jgi:hypothetical protein
MPGYWFMYNMYALARNAWKYIDRDKRIEKTQHLEYAFLAPDSINEVLHALQLMEQYAGKKALADKMDTIEMPAGSVENSKRKVVLLKAAKSYQLFKELVIYYAVEQMLQFASTVKFKTADELFIQLPKKQKRSEWVNVGGQLIPVTELNTLKQKIVSGKIKSWDAVHAFYAAQAKHYPQQKLQHAMSSLFELTGTAKLTKENFVAYLQSYLATKTWMVEGIASSREKDYTSPFRKMMYETEAELEAVTGKLKENSFILQQQEELKQTKAAVQKMVKQLKL